MNINFLFETILILFAILVSNGIIYSLTYFNFNKTNSSENISIITKSSEKDGLALTSLIASNPISLTSSDSNTSWDIFDNENLIDSEISLGTQTENSNSLITYGEIWPSNIEDYDNFIPLDSLTILNSQSFEQWREIAVDLHELPINTPAGIIQQVKFEELNILYSQDILHYAITQTELRLIIEHLPATSLFNPEVNHFILTIMAYYHL